MNFGLSENDYQLFQNEVVLPLKKTGLNLFIFGSRARGDFKNFSDFDLMYENCVTKEQDLKVAEVIENLSKSNFPYKVDLVKLEDFSLVYLDSYLKDRIQL